MSYVKTATEWTIRRGDATVSTKSDTSFPTGNFNGALGSESSTAGSYALSGDIAEVLVYDHDVIADGTWQTIYNYLSARYYPAPAGGPPNAGLRLWMKSNAGVITNTPPYVNQWNDQSDYGNSPVQSNAVLMPSVTTATVGERQSWPVVRFSGGTNALGFTLPCASNYTGMSVFYVASRGSAQAANETVFSSGGPNAGNTPGIRWALGLGSAASQGLGWGGTAADVNLGNGSFAAADTFYIMSL